MPIPMSIARFNRVVTNRITVPLAPYLPGFGVIVHTGRQTGARYRTPVNVFRSGGGFIVALTYGTESQWVKNVVASGGCALEARGQRLRITRPRLFHDEHRSRLPWIVRTVLGLAKVSDFLELAVVDGDARRSGVDASG